MPLPSILDRRVSARLTDAILSLQPTAYWPLDDGRGPLRDLTGRWPAAVTGTPTFGVAAPDPVGRGVTWSGTGQYATTSGSVPTPSTSISVLVAYSTTNATASLRNVFGRGAASQVSWGIGIGAAHGLRFDVYQSGGTSHATAAPSGVTNTGAWILGAGTFDGTTIKATRSIGGVVATPTTSTTLTGSWHKASTAGVQVAALTSGGLFPGTVALAVYWADRLLTDAEFRWLNSIAFGG